MNQKHLPRSASFLLRCWQEPRTHTGTHRIWRYSLEDIRTGRRVGFTSLEAALGYIREQLEERMKDER